MYLQPLDSLREEFERSGRELVSFANYDYAGLANDPPIKKAACAAIMSIGVGARATGASARSMALWRASLPLFWALTTRSRWSAAT